MATIYVLRPSSYGSAVKFRVYEGDSLIGRLGPKSYLAWNIKPEGKEVTIVSRSENKDTFIINPKAGKTYYIKQRVKMGFAFARTGLEQLDQAEGKKILRRLKKPKLNYAE